MKEIVDRILQDEVVDIVGEDKRYHVSVRKKENNFLFAFAREANFDRDYSRQSLYLKEIKELGEKLITLHDELKNRKEFKVGEPCFFVRPDGQIYKTRFNDEDSGHIARVVFGNVFKTSEEAEAHKDEVMAKYQALRDEGVI